MPLCIVPFERLASTAFVWICSAVPMVYEAPVWLNLVEKRSVKYLDLYAGSCHKRKKTNVIFISRQLGLPVQRFTLSGVAAGCCQPSQR